MTDLSCGVEPSIQLSEEQVYLLNTHPTVTKARQAYLEAQCKTILHPDTLEVITVAKQLQEEYYRAFQEQLVWVVANPPKLVPPPEKTRKGFANRP
jgi:hypothetical protein